MTIKRATVAAPIAKNILEDTISALDIKKPSEGILKEYRYFDVKYVSVPNVVGLNKKDSREYLKNFLIEYSGVGEHIVSMSPDAGSRVPAGSTIRLMLG